MKKIEYSFPKDSIIVCVNTGTISTVNYKGSVFKGAVKNITKGKYYNALNDPIDQLYVGVAVIDDLGIESHYDTVRFVTISEYRKMKIEKMIKNPN